MSVNSEDLSVQFVLRGVSYLWSSMLWTSFPLWFSRVHPVHSFTCIVKYTPKHGTHTLTYIIKQPLNYLSRKASIGLMRMALIAGKVPAAVPSTKNAPTIIIAVVKLI